ncbi:vitamin D(3) 25-hydroxylase-like isoform X3 [Equus quagga]|uniref:vitamin D(3) 25-hydroxylase-like isoform X3 n=1 Tax=Equus quagga TaxID=89248 RepID=UPI001EE2EBBB|nr:vitamin D(3) 25-hydroxylase-like isoform X3 [Equus quagga]
MAQGSPKARAWRLGPAAWQGPGLSNALDPGLQLRDRFGDVFSLQLAWTPAVVINGLAAMREALVHRSEDTSDRPPVPIFEHLGFGPRSEGLVMARYGQTWREQRRFSVSTLRNFALGKKSLEQWVTEEASYLCAAFDDQAGRPFSPDALLNKAVSNVIASLTFGRRFDYQDPRFLRLLDLTEDLLKEETGFAPQVLNAIPMFLHIPGLPAKVFPGHKAFMALLDELIAEHRKTRDLAQPPRDLTDAFLDEVEKAVSNRRSMR